MENWSARESQSENPERARTERPIDYLEYLEQLFRIFRIVQNT